MSSYVFDRLVPSAGVFTLDRLVDAVGVPLLTSVGIVRDGSAITLTGTSFSASGNAVFVVQGDFTVQIPVSSEGTTSITTTALDTSTLYLTQPIAIYITNNASVSSNTIVATILPVVGTSAYAINQEFLGDATTRASSSPDLSLTDEVRIRNVVGGTISDISMTGQGAFVVNSSITSFDYAIQDGDLLGDFAAVSWANPVTSANPPNVIGQLEQVGEDAIVAAGFVPVVIARLPSLNIALGNISAQFPDSSTSLVIGGTVELTVSLGADVVIVPIFIGTRLADAELARSLVPLTGQTYRYIDGVNSGFVLNQSVRAGEVVATRSAVDIVVSSNLTPNVLGQIIQDAIAIITSANLIASDTVSMIFDRLAPAYTVIVQSPLPDTMIAPGAVISMTISLGPPPAIPGATPLRKRIANTYQ